MHEEKEIPFWFLVCYSSVTSYLTLSDGDDKISADIFLAPHQSQEKVIDVNHERRAVDA